MNSKRFYQLIAVASLLALAAILFWPHTRDGISFETTGKTSHDVTQALVELGRLEALPSDATSRATRHAIENAERQYGLPTDGVADQSLLDQLVAELASGDRRTMTAWTLDDANKLAGIVSTLSAVVFGFMGFRRKSG